MLDMARLAQLGLNTEEGLAYCADDPEFYEEMLGEYVTEGKKNVAELQCFFDESDWPNYAIRAHTLKTISRTIGAQALSEHARELELAAKAQDDDIVGAAHALFVDDCKTLIAAIETVLG